MKRKRIVLFLALVCALALSFMPYKDIGAQASAPRAIPSGGAVWARVTACIPATTHALAQNRNDPRETRFSGRAQEYEQTVWISNEANVPMARLKPAHVDDASRLVARYIKCLASHPHQAPPASV